MLVRLQLQRAVADFVDQIELEWGVSFAEGRNSRIGFMAHVWEDLRVLPKPLALHLVCELVSALAGALLWQMGFRMDTCHVRTQLLLTHCKSECCTATHSSFRPDRMLRGCME